jgi:hypothetical protein
MPAEKKTQSFCPCSRALNKSGKGFIKPELPREIFKKYSNTKFHENPSSES